MRPRFWTALAITTLAASALAACGGESAMSASQRSVPATAQPGSAPATTQPASPLAAGPTPTSSGGALAGKTIVLDPGHNGGNERHPEIINRPVPAGPFTKPCNTTGTATTSGYSEHAFNFDVATRLAAILRKEGAHVVLTRPDDTGVGPCVNVRAEIANQAHADAVIAIHADGAPASGYGFHVILPSLVKGYTEPIIAPATKLGHAVRDAFHQGTGEPYSSYLGHQGIDIRGDLAGLNLSKVPAVFIECGNMSNPDDAAHMTDPSWRQKAAESLAAGLATYLRS